jgi:hypothetical protein
VWAPVITIKKTTPIAAVIAVRLSVNYWTHIWNRTKYFIRTIVTKLLPHFGILKYMVFIYFHAIMTQKGHI